MTDLEREKKIYEIYTHAVALDKHAREAYVLEACVDDPSLAEEVRKCLAGAETRDTTFEKVGSHLERRLVDDHLQQLRKTLSGRFTVEHLVGSGGMGEVYYGRQEQPPRPVAVKRCHEALGSAEARQRFYFESQALAILDHPAIAQVIEAGTDSGGAPYFVMEYIEGRCLEDYCDDQQLDVRERIALFCKVARALSHAHGRGIIHRDLKPGNIMVQEVDGLPNPKVIDFGIAKIMTRFNEDQPEIHGSAQMGTRGSLGSPDYMSPEQTPLLDQPVDVQTDVYGLGGVLYKLLTGHAPLELSKEPGLEQMFQTIVHKVPTHLWERVKPAVDQRAKALGMTPRALKRSLNVPLNSIVQKALRKQPKDRYENVAALVADLEAWLAGRLVAAAPATPTYVAGKWVRSNRNWLAVAGVLTGALLFTVMNLAMVKAEQVRTQRTLGLFTELLGSASPESKGPETTVKELLDDFAVTIPERFPDEPDIRISLLRTLTSAYNALGVYDESVEAAAEAWELACREDGSGSLLAAETRAELGSVYINQAHFKEGEEHLEAALKDYARHKGHSNLEYLGLRNELGTNTYNQGRIYEAMTLFLENLDYAGDLEENQEERYKASYLIGLCLRQLGALDESEAFLAKAVSGFEETTGFENMDALMALSSYGDTLQELKRYEEALACAEKAVRTGVAWLGEEHPFTMICKNSYAFTLLRVEDMQRASDLFEALASNAEASLGATHMATISYKSNAAFALEKLQCFDLAESGYLSCLDALTTVYGANNPNVFRLKINLAVLYSSTNRRALAVEKINEVIDGRIQLHGEDSPKVADARDWLMRVQGPN